MTSVALTALLCGAVAFGRAVPAGASPAANPLRHAQELFDARRYDGVIRDLPEAEIEKLPRQSRPPAYALLGRSYAMQGQQDKALAVLQVAAQIFPNDINVLSELAEVLRGAGLVDSARPVYERILAIHPHNAAAHYGLARILDSMGFLDSAADHYRECLSEWGNDPRAWQEYARVLSERRDYPEAMRAIQKALSINPKDLDALDVLADVEYRQGLRQKAYDTLEHALAAVDHDSSADRLKPEMALQLSLWLLEEGNLDRSRSKAEDVLRRFPHDPLGLWIRGVVSMRRGRTDEARRDLKEAADSFRQAPFVARSAEELLRELR